MTYVLPTSASNTAIKVHLDRPTPANPIRQLWLERANGQTELVWKSKSDPNWSVLPIKPSGLDEYSDAKILAANCSKTRLVVMFEFRWNKDDKRTNICFSDYTWFHTPKDVEAWDGRIQFMRTFVQDEKGAWRIEASAFPQTLWKSVRGESVVGIKMRDDGKFSLVYAGAWSIVPDQKIGFRKEIGAKEGTTTFTVVFDEKSKLILTVDDKGKNYYVPESLWWLGKDEWFVGPFNQIPERKIFLWQQEKKARELGIDLTNNSRF